MQRHPVKSSNIESVGYDPASRTMHMEFKGGKVYEYPGVPPDVHSALLSSPSPGSHFAKHIRPVYVGRKIEA